MMTELQGHHLGARHKYLNSLSKSITQEQVSFKDVDISAGDIINIVKIDLASTNRNINYILIVLQCEDIFYVSRALKQCSWLISDTNYENIINPEYLNKVLYPKMTTKAVTKLKKYIKLNLKDANRVQQFYTHEENEKEALEWLPHCSPDFIVTNFKKHIDYVDIPLLKRLCEKTIAALEIYLDCDKNYYKKREALQATTFLLKIDFEKYLNLIEKHSEYNLKFNSNCTKYILKQDASRIINNFECYCLVIDIKTFLDHLKKENIKCFLYKIFESKKSKERRFIKFEMLVSFLNAMPEVDRLETVKQVFLDRIHLIEDKYPLPKPLRISMNNLYKFVCTCKWDFVYDHYWYRFTTFDFAYPQIIKKVSNETSVEEINSIVETLIIVASDSEKNLTELVEYFCKNYKNGDMRLKKSLILNMLKVDSLTLNRNTWEKMKNTFMCDIFNETDETVYDENFVQLCIEFIIINEIIHTGKISHTIQKRFKFNSLKRYKDKLPEECREKLFGILLNIISNKINSYVYLNKKDFLNKIELLDSALDLLNDWNKDLIDYPDILNIIKDIVVVNEQNCWDVDFSKIYNKKKSWRRHLFSVSLKMHPSQMVFLNILKHDPILLESCAQVEKKVYEKGICLEQYHKKLKIFWPESKSKQLVQTCEQQLKSGTCNKTVFRALCICMPRESLMRLLIQYIPQQDVINWATIDERHLNIQQTLAMNMHIARPQPGPEIVLEYAKGDHVPFTLPALYSIFYNMNLSQSQKFIPMLLNGKVSLQKHGIRLAFMKLSPMEVNKLLTEVLRDNRNLTIRHVAFTLTFKVLCKQNNSARIQYLWPIMDNFMNNLTYQENKAIYDLLSDVEKLPVSVQPLFFPKAYMFLKGLISSKIEYYEDMKYSFKSLITYASENCNILSPEFIKSILLEYINNELPNKVDNFTHSSKIELLSAFILCSDTQESISEKCQTVLLPFLQKCFKHWDDIHQDVENEEIKDESTYCVRLYFHNFITTFSKDTKKFISEKVVPTEAFEIIQNEFQLSVDTPSCYYLTMTMLQLNYTFLVIFKACKQGDDWEKTCATMLPKLAITYKDLLKEHCNKYFTNVYVLFGRVLHIILTQYLTKSMIFVFLKHLLHDEKFIPLYLVVIKLISYHSELSAEDTKSIEDLFVTISSHTSLEVQMHYYQCLKFKN